MQVKYLERTHRGSAIVETLIIFPVFLIIALGALQWSLIYEAKSTLNYATFMAARAGAVQNAGKTAINTALVRGMLPLFSPNKNITGLLGAAASASTKVLPYTRIRILNPTKEAFADFGVTPKNSSVKEIPNDRLNLQSTVVGSQSGMNIQDANILKLEVMYGHELKVPFVNKVITTVVSWFTTDPVKLAYLRLNRLPILSTSIVRMQSAARENSLIVSQKDIDNKLKSAQKASTQLPTTLNQRPWQSGPTGGNKVDYSHPNLPPIASGGGSNGGGSSGGGSGGSSGGGSSGGGSSGGLPGNGNPSSCSTSGPASNTTTVASASAGNPIHVVTGNKYQNEVDIAPLPGEMGLEFVRHYNSRTTYQGSMGYGWSHSYDVRFTVNDESHITLRQADGRVLYFQKQKNNRYIAQQASDGEVVKVSAGYDWRWLNGKKLEFSKDGKLQRIVAPTGLATQLLYSADGKLVKVVDPQDRRISFIYNSLGYLVSMTDPTGAGFTYEYDSKGNLEKAIYPGKAVRQYHYEDPHDVHNLTGITDQRGVRYATWAYDDQDRAILSTHIDDVQKVTLVYKNNQTLVTNSQGVTSTYTTGYINQVPVVKLIAGPGCSTCGTGDVGYSYNNRIQLTGISTLKGENTVNVYDNFGRIKLQKWLRNGNQRAAIQYEYKGRSLKPYKIIKPSINPKAKHIATIKYNENGQITNITESGYRPLGNGKFSSIERHVVLKYKNGMLESIDGPRKDVKDIVRFVYNDLGQLSKVMEPNGNANEILEYDSYGRPERLRTNGGPVTKVEYDLFGNIKKLQRGQQSISFLYDLTGKLKRITRADGEFFTIKYDAAGRKIATLDKQGNKTGFIWNKEDQLVSQYVREKSGKIISAALRLIDTQGKVWGVMTPDGVQAIQGYDSKGNTLISANGKAQGDYYIRNARGQLLGMMAADKGVTKYIADAKGRISAIRDPMGRVTIHLYDDFGNLVLKRSPDTGITKYTYDLSGNLLSRIDNIGQKTSYKYDEAGKLIQIKNKDRTTKFTYKNARLARINDGLGGESYEYNDMGQLVAHHRTIDSRKFTTKYQYSESTGKLVEKTLPSGEVIEYQYKASQGRLSYIGLKKWFAHEPILSDINYQPFGTRTGFTQQNGIRTEFKYDQTGRIRKLITRDVGTLEYKYDESGNIIGIYRNRDKEKYEYDSVGRLVHASTVTGVHDFKYDFIGSRINNSAQKPRTSTKNAAFFSYNKLGLAVKSGNRRYEYNADHRPAKLFVGGKLVAEYVYNAKGERIKKTVYSGHKIKIHYFLYDLQRRLSALVDDKGNIIREYQYLGRTPVAIIQDGAIYSIHTDHLGTPYKITDESRKVLWAASYDPFGKVHIQKANIEFNVRFTGQYQDTESSMYYNYFRDYDPSLGRYLQSDPMGVTQGLNGYHYVNNSPIQGVDPFGLFKVQLGPVGVPIHENIVIDAFNRFNQAHPGAFSNDTINLFVYENKTTDLNQIPTLHFDNPNDRPPFITQGSMGLLNATVTEYPSWIDNTLASINQKRALYGTVVNGPIIGCKLDRSGSLYEYIDIRTIITSFGQNTHTLADFYAHSNWVDPASRGGYYLQEIYDPSVPTYNRRILEEGYVPTGLNRKVIWDEKAFVGLYTGTAEAGTALSDYYHNVFSGVDSFGNPDKTTHAYWSKDLPNNQMTTDSNGNAISTHDLARELAVRHTLKEIQKLWDASKNNPQLRSAYGMTNSQKKFNNIKFN